MKTKKAHNAIKSMCLTALIMAASGQTLKAQEENFFKPEQHVRPIFLNEGNFIVPPVTDCLQQGASVQNVVLPAVGSSRTWDYSKLVKNDAFTLATQYSRVTNPAFKSARRQDNFVFALAGVLPILQTAYEGVNKKAYYRAGRSIERQSFPIQAFTGYPTDSLIIVQQNVPDEGNYTLVPFPTTASSNWTSTARALTYFQISIAGFGLDKVPGYFVQRQTLSRKVVGWGKTRIPFGKGKSEFIPVLLVQSVVTTTDSVYLGNAPAPDALAAAFGIVQGQQHSDNAYVFLREGINEPLLSFTTDPSFKTIRSIQYDTKFVDIYEGCTKEKLCFNGQKTKAVPFAEVTPLIVGSDNIRIGSCAGSATAEDDLSTEKSIEVVDGIQPAAIQLKAYPNPTSSEFILTIPNSAIVNTQVRITDQAGRSLLSLNTKDQQVHIGNTLKPGIYFAEIIQGTKKQTIKLVKF